MRWKLWLGIAVSLVLLWVAFRGVQPEEIVQSMAGVRPGWLVLVVLSLPVRFWLTAVRWRFLLGRAKRVGLHRLFGITLIGFMANNLLPARMGEFVRAYALAKSETLSMSLSFATIVVERLFDGFTLLLFLVASAVFLKPERWIVVPALMLFGVYVVVVIGLVWLRRGGSLAPIIRWLPGRLQGRATEMLDSFASGLDVLGDAPTLGAVAGLSIVIWGVNVAGLHAMFVAFSLDVPAYASALVMGILTLTLAAPSTPGYVGPFQAGTVVALGLFGVPKATALSLSIVYHALNYIPITLAGLAYLGAFNLTLGELQAAGEKTA
jgi:glycosyltransferase 2 family protein